VQYLIPTLIELIGIVVVGIGIGIEIARKARIGSLLITIGSVIVAIGAVLFAKFV